MMSKCIRLVLHPAMIVVLYIIIGIFTWAFRYQRQEPDSMGRVDRIDAGACGMFAGVFWPIYWVGKFALRVTAPDRIVEK